MSNSYYLSKEITEQVKEYAKHQERSESAVVRFALKQFFEGLNKNDRQSDE